MSVKTIFKTLIGTIAIMVLYSCCVELFNVNITGMQIKQTCNMAANQAAELFTQETYREGKNSNNQLSRSTRMKDIKASDDSVYVSGDFYNGKTKTADIWNMLYAGNSSNFKKICELQKGHDKTFTFNGKTVKYSLKKDDAISYNHTYFAPGNTVASIYKELDELYGGLYKSNSASSFMASVNLGWNQFLNSSGTYANLINKKSACANALRMSSNMYTPVNIGFPYFDPIITNKIFQWNLATILSNGDKDSIQKETQSQPGNERYYINYKGFRCYANEAVITNFNYYILNVKTSRGRNRLKNLTGLDASALQRIGSGENNYIAVVGLQYSIPIAYEGITPIANVFRYVWNNEVKGLRNNRLYDDGTDRTNITGTGNWNFATRNMTNSSNSNNGMMPATGELYYVLVR